MNIITLHVLYQHMHQNTCCITDSRQKLNTVSQSVSQRTVDANSARTVVSTQMYTTIHRTAPWYLAAIHVEPVSAQSVPPTVL